MNSKLQQLNTQYLSKLKTLGIESINMHKINTMVLINLESLYANQSRLSVLDTVSLRSLINLDISGT